MAIKGRENTNESGGVGEAGREREGERGREEAHWDFSMSQNGRRGGGKAR